MDIQPHVSANCFRFPKAPTADWGGLCDCRLLVNQMAIPVVGLNLVIAAIVYWNAVYLQAAISHLRSTSAVVPNDFLAHTSPVGWGYSAFSGDFLWDKAPASKGRKLPVDRS